MRNIVSIITLTVCLGFSMVMIGQPTPIKHWTFDADEASFLASMNSMVKPNVSEGIAGFGVYLDGKNQYFTPRILDLNKQFSISFWIKPTNAARAQTVFIQEKIENRTMRNQRFLQLYLENQQLHLRNEYTNINIAPIKVEDGEWYFVSYIFDGYVARIYWQGEEVFSTNDISLFTKTAGQSDLIHIGKDWNYKRLEAVLDEIKIYDNDLPASAFKDEFKIMKAVNTSDAIVTDANPEPPINKPNNNNPNTPPNTPAVPPLPTAPVAKTSDARLTNTLRGRENDIQHTIRVMYPNIEVEVWDADILPEDVLSISLNNSDSIRADVNRRVVRKKRKHERYKFELQPDGTNYLTFIAEDMGLYDLQNELEIRISVNGVRFDDIYKIVTTKKKNAVLKIIHVPFNPKKENILAVPSDDADDLQKVVVDNNLLAPLVVSSTAVTLRIKGEGSASRKVQIKLDDELLSAPFQTSSTSPQTLTFNVGTRNEKILYLEALELKREDACAITLEVENNGKIIKTYSLQLDQANALLPIVYVPDEANKSPKNQRTVVVASKNLVIKIKDNSKVDGDIVTIKQDGIVILNNHLLSEDYKSINVRLKPNTANNFVFVPVSMGRASGENTAFVVIEADGEVIQEFSLRSQYKNKPAQLIIIHKK